jgi:deoxycytidylate deaminase
MYTQGIPCADCANDIIQGKIVEVVVHKEWHDFEQKFQWDKWNGSSKRSVEKFAEVGIKIRVFSKVLGLLGVLDGKVITI